MTAPFLPLELVGQLVGIELIIISIVLTFRHKYVDGFCYPWQIPFSFFFAGAAVVMIVSEFTVVWWFNSFGVAYVGYLTIGVMGLVGLHYFWYIYPYQHIHGPSRDPP